MLWFVSGAIGWDPMWLRYRVSFMFLSMYVVFLMY